MTMYASRNFETKKALKEAVAAGEPLTAYSAGLGSPPVNGDTSVCGPWYPRAHKWYARVRIANGKIVRVLS